MLTSPASVTCRRAPVTGPGRPTASRRTAPRPAAATRRTQRQMPDVQVHTNTTSEASMTLSGSVAGPRRPDRRPQAAARSRSGSNTDTIRWRRDGGAGVVAVPESLSWIAWWRRSVRQPSARRPAGTVGRTGHHGRLAYAPLPVVDVNFGVHTGPANTTVDELRSLWRRDRGAAVRLDLDLGTTSRRTDGRPTALDVVAHTALALETSPGAVRVAGVLRRLPPPRRAGERHRRHRSASRAVGSTSASAPAGWPTSTTPTASPTPPGADPT